MNVDEAIAIVKSKAKCRTRYEGQEPRLDEVLVEEIERLWAESHVMKTALTEIRDTGTGEWAAFALIALLEAAKATREKTK